MLCCQVAGVRDTHNQLSTCPHTVAYDMLSWCCAVLLCCAVLSGGTGSCLYMAPEVYLAHCYNEKSDVFSYAVVLYELFTRCLIVFTELPTNSTDPDGPQR